jgi:hypothetical protein
VFFFWKRTKKFSRVFELPLPRNAEKRTKKKEKKREKKVRIRIRTFFCELAQMHVVFPGFFFFCRPLAAGHFADRGRHVCGSSRIASRLSQGPGHINTGRWPMAGGCWLLASSIIYSAPLGECH